MHAKWIVNLFFSQIARIILHFAYIVYVVYTYSHTQNTFSCIWVLRFICIGTVEANRFRSMHFFFDLVCDGCCSAHSHYFLIDGWICNSQIVHSSRLNCCKRNVLHKNDDEEKCWEFVCASFLFLFFSFCFSALRSTSVSRLIQTDGHGQRQMIRFIWFYRQMTMIMHILYTGSNSFMGAKWQ